MLLEGGPRLAAAFLDAGLVDEVVVYLAPTLLGAGQPALDGGAVARWPTRIGPNCVDVTRIGPDVRLRYRISNARRAHHLP